MTVKGREVVGVAKDEDAANRLVGVTNDGSDPSRDTYPKVARSQSKYLLSRVFARLRKMGWQS